MNITAEKGTLRISPYLEELRERALGEGGFGFQAGREYRPDATSWAILALAATGIGADIVEPARKRLADSQESDGRVCISAEHPDAFWPTPLAALAWHGSPGYREPQSRAVRFLVATTGRHFARTPDHPLAHDTSLRGWPWIAETHSMVEPTALALLVLRITGHEDHEHAREAARMLMDRQLPTGGWNYGNTAVYGQELHPQPENTGLALCALSGLVSRADVQRSMDYLSSRILQIRTPLSLGWGLLGLGSWGKRSVQARSWVLNSLQRQKKYGPYETTLLSLLILAFQARGGFSGVIGR
jgi:hypothetical protein